MRKSRRQRHAQRAQQLGNSHGNDASAVAASRAVQPSQLSPAELVEHPVIIHQAELDGVAEETVALEAPPGVDTVHPYGAVDEPLERPQPTAMEPPVEIVSLPELPAATARAFSIDALRGLFLLVMTLGFTIQGGMFPDWMYHRQTPPGADPFIDIAGISWRDLAYAAFIFTMAAALPITLSRRIDKGETDFGIAGTALRRGFLLFVFALLIGHSNTYFIGYTQTGRAVAVLGFLIMFALFTRRRSDWNERWHNALRRAAWIAAIAFLALSPLAYDSTFSPARRDQVIAVLAFAVVAGSLLWYVTRHHLGPRLAALAGAVALYLGARGDGWINELWWSSPAPWLFQPSYLSLLIIVIPGTIAGDQVLRWMRAPQPDEPAVKPWSAGRILLLSAIAIAFTPIAIIGLYNRWMLETTQLSAALCLAGLFVLHRATYPGERMLRSLFLWGALWLMIGLVLDPFENGIRKVPETLSYFFTVTGLTTLLLVAFAGVVDLLQRQRWVRSLIDVGQNPMLCYILFTVFLNSVFEAIPPLRGVLRGSPGASLLRSILTVALVVVIVRAFTRARIYWRT